MIGGFCFELVLGAMKDGKRVAREGWGEGCLLLAKKADKSMIFIRHVDQGKDQDGLGFIEIKNWVPNEEDILAEDWRIVMEDS